MFLEIKFSKEYEIKRIRQTLGKYDWYVAQKYKLNLPVAIKEKVEKDLFISDEEIAKEVDLEFDSDFYDKKRDKLVKDWNLVEDKFLESLSSLSGNFCDSYTVNLTRYGVGGSYGRPNFIQLNIDYNISKEPWEIVAHEIIHLNIEDWIEEYKIDHWTKERLVDLITNRFFPDKNWKQRDPSNSEGIKKVFDEYFPDVKKVIQKSSI